MPIFAVSIMSILALVGATIALGMDSRSGNQLQHSADSAALGGATAFLNFQSPKAAERLEAAREQATKLATSNANYQLAELVIDAVTEDAYGQRTQLAVELKADPVNFFANFAGKNASAPMRRRAVAAATWGFPLCMLSLSEDKESGLSVKHRADFRAKGCIVWSNTDSHKSMEFKGGSAEARYFCAAGTAKKGFRADVTPQPTDDCEPIPDPLEKWKPPVEGMCQPSPDFQPPRSILAAVEEKLKKSKGKGRDEDDDDDDDDDEDDDEGGGLDNGLATACSGPGADQNPNCPENPATGEGLTDYDQLALTDNMNPLLYSLDKQYDTSTATLSPGTYCGLDIAYGHVVMSPGTYFIKGAPMTVTRKATVTAEGVTIVFTDPHAYLRVSDEARLDLKAPKHGPLAGIAVAERRNTAVRNKPVVTRLTGAGAMSIIGLVYIPTQNFFISGSGAGEQASPLLQIVANRMALRDTGKLTIDFEPGKTDIPMVIKPAREARLVE